MVKTGDILEIKNMSYCLDDDERTRSEKQYYVISKIESGTLFVKRSDKPQDDAATIHNIPKLRKWNIVSNE